MRQTPLLAMLLLTACTTFNPRSIPSQCPPQWQIPLQYKDGAQTPEAIENLRNKLDDLTLQLKALTTLLQKRYQQPSMTVPITPPSSPSNPKP